MSQALIFAFQFVAPILAGLLVTRYLRTSMWRLLVDLCGTTGRADFWVRVSAVLITAAPLALVLLTSANPPACSVGELACAVGVLRRTCIFTLIGVLAAVGFVASIIRRAIPHEASAPREADVVERAA